MILSPETTRAADLDNGLRERGHVVLAPADLFELAGVDAADVAPLAGSWNALPPDPHLRDGGHYRFRRHACFVIDAVSGEVTQTAPRPHWQPLEYNALHGGIERWFAPMDPETIALAAWRSVLSALAVRLARLAGVDTWFVEAHQFRIDTAEGIGRPTPEGAHRDGVDFVAVMLVARHAVKGGETRVFDAAGPAGIRFTITEPWTTLLLDDARVIHETTPIQPEAEGGVRDTLVLTFRRGGFQGPRAIGVAATLDEHGPAGFE